MVELRVNLQKKHVWLLALLIVAVGLVIAQGGGVSHPTSEITGLDTRVNQLIDAKLATVNVLQNKDLVEWKYFYQNTQAKWKKDAQGNDDSLASYTTVYGRGGLAERGCRHAMNFFCKSEGYDQGIGHPTCGWSFNNDEPCPDLPNCNLGIYCFKTVK